MKKIILIAVMALQLSSHAQIPTEFWGVTSRGGNGYGTFFKTSNTGSNAMGVQSFRGKISAAYPVSAFCRGINGNLYAAMDGGTYDQGTIVALDPVTGTLLKMVDFHYPENGVFPNGMTAASNGKFYGATYNYTNNAEHGSLFEYDPAINVLTKKITFNGLNGSVPMGEMILAVNGKFYGVTSFGGDHNNPLRKKFHLKIR